MKGTEGKLVTSASHGKPQKITNKLEWGPSNKYILTDNREIQKNELYPYKMEKKTWPNNNLCTRELGMGSIIAAQNVALKTTSGARDVCTQLYSTTG